MKIFEMFNVWHQLGLICNFRKKDADPVSCLRVCVHECICVMEAEWVSPLDPAVITALIICPGGAHTGCCCRRHVLHVNSPSCQLLAFMTPKTVTLETVSKHKLRFQRRNHSASSFPFHLDSTDGFSYRSTQAAALKKRKKSDAVDQTFSDTTGEMLFTSRG